MLNFIDLFTLYIEAYWEKKLQTMCTTFNQEFLIDVIA
jgi:hypothetical protein